MMEFACLYEASRLPPAWDDLTDSYFQCIRFLMHVEKYNPCRQRYYLCYNDGIFVSAAIVYSLRLDLLTYAGLKSPITMNIVGVPCSVSSAGIFGTAHGKSALKNHLFKTEKGFVLALNLKEITVGAHASAKTLPTIVLQNHFSSWQEYVSSLRSPYRRRLKKIHKAGEDLRIDNLPCSCFTQRMHEQYLEVYKRSTGKLEKLSCDFFRFLPKEFTLTVCYLDQTVIGWNLGVGHGNTYSFFLGGYDYKRIKEHNTYFVLLAETVKQGIAQGAGIIDLGQTAEIPKIRMGGRLIPLYMEAHHGNVIIDKMLKAGGSMLGYKKKTEAVNAFREEGV